MNNEFDHIRNITKEESTFLEEADIELPRNIHSAHFSESPSPKFADEVMASNRTKFTSQNDLTDVLKAIRMSTETIDQLAHNMKGNKKLN